MITIANLTKTFKSITAVSDVNLEIPSGEIFGLLGPNGAGKTTLLMVLCTILKPTKGSINVDGNDIIREPEKVRRRLGLAFQEPVLDTRLSVENNLEFHARACGLPSSLGRERIKGILNYLDLWDMKNQKAGRLSGGMKKKVEDAKVFIQEPSIAIFDEPTAYLDVTSRLKVWKLINILGEKGCTVIVATNMMDEADRLCKRVAILSRGSLVVVGKPSALKDAIPGGDVIEILVSGDAQQTAGELGRMPDVSQVILLAGTNRLRVYVNRAELKLPRILETLLSRGTRIESVEVKEPSLDDVFVHYTGETL